jgi:hypothetical protein
MAFDLGEEAPLQAGLEALEEEPFQEPIDMMPLRRQHTEPVPVPLRISDSIGARLEEVVVKNTFLDFGPYSRGRGDSQDSGQLLHGQVGLLFVPCLEQRIRSLDDPSSDA